MAIGPQSTRHISAPSQARLGWWHLLWRKALLAGVQTGDIPPLAGDVPAPIRNLTQLIEERRGAYAAIARARGADYKGGYWMMYLFAPIAVFCSAFAAASPRLVVILYGIELLLIITILLLFMLMRRGSWQEQWIRARRTAEHLRYLPLVAPFVRNRSANWYQDIASHHGMRVIVDDDVTRACEWLADQEANLGDRLREPIFYRGYIKYVDELLTQQIHYHSNNAAMERILARRISIASSSFFGITIVCTAVIFFETLTGAVGLGRYIEAKYLRLCAAVLPAIGGGLRGLLAQGESHRVAALSEGMAVRLAQLRDQLRKLQPMAAFNGELEALVWNSTQELLSEADTWMRLQESVPLSVAG